MLNDQMIKNFIEVVRRESFSKAAEELYTSQQAVSKQVKKLEEVLDTSLLKRDTRHVELTPAGREYYEMFLKWEMDFEQVSRKVDRISNQNKRLRIGMISRMNSGKIPMLVHRLKDLDEEYQLSIVHDAPLLICDGLMQDDLDLIITYEDFITDTMRKAEKLDKLLLGKTELMLCIASSHKEIEDLSELSMEPMLVCVDRGVNKKEALEHAVADRKKYGLGNGTIKLFHTIEEVNMMTELGEGFCLCSSTNMFVKNSYIKTYPLPKVTRIVAVWKKKNPSKPLKEFFRILKEEGPAEETILPFGELL